MECSPAARSDRHARIVMVGPFPPFVGGAAKNTEIIARSLEARSADVTRLATNRTRVRGEHARSLALYLDRSAGFAANLTRLIALRVGGGGTLYLVPDGGPGVIFSAFYALAGACLFDRILIHHRNYSHIRTRSRFMHAILKAAPDKTHHIFLDPVMEAEFAKAYGVTMNSSYVPNAATCDVTPGNGPRQPGPPVVGFLSNLTEEKGFDVVADAFMQLSQESGQDYRFALAGRPVNIANSQRLAELQAALGDRLDYRGEVFDADKEAFFRACDVFVFPTRFSQEAQPNVLYEAMAGGAAIVSTRWAGVPWVLENSVARLIEPGAGRGQELAAAVRALVTGADLDDLRRRQIAAFRAKKADADVRFAGLLNRLSEK